MQARRVGETVDLLGESCVWSQEEQALYWVDVRAPALRRLDYARQEIESFSLPELVGCVALRADGGVVLAMQSCIAVFDLTSRTCKTIARPPHPFPDLRFNDGRCDRQGRFWAGTMDDVKRGEVGALYRLERDRLETVLSPIFIPNSLAWSPDGRTMYFSDTVSRTILAYDFEPETGTPANPRVFATVEGWGTPDGSTVDAEGFLWNAEYDGGRITRYAPGGQIDRVIEMPVRRPTCCAFGGPELSILFVTTASQKLTAAELAAQPLSGCLLALDTGTRGIPEPVFSG